MVEDSILHPGDDFSIITEEFYTQDMTIVPLATA